MLDTHTVASDCGTAATIFAKMETLQKCQYHGNTVLGLAQTILL